MHDLDPGGYCSSAMNTTRALVTGAAGFIGSHVAAECLQLGMEVVAVDDLSGGFEAHVPAGCQWIPGDLRDPAFVHKIFTEHRLDRIYHLAAYAAEGLSHFVRRFNYETNLMASIHLINASVRAEVDCFVFASSIAVYGTGNPPLTEDMVPRPEDPYGISKFAVELDLRSAGEMFDLDWIVFRPHNVYGERQNIADRYRNVIGIFMNQALQDRPLTIFGDGSQTRAFSHICDVAPIIARSPDVDGARNQVFNVGSDSPFTVLELAHEVQRVLGTDLPVRHLPPRLEVLHAYCDHTRVREVFAPPPPLDLGTGLERMAAWVRDHGSREPSRFGEIELTKNMPASWLDGE